MNCEKNVCVFSSNTPFLPLHQSHQPSWLRFGIGDCAVFLERYFSCISDTLKGEEDKGGVGEKTPSRCVSPREGLEPCHSCLSLHQLSLIASEDRRPQAWSFLILFSAFRRVKSELLLLIFFLICFFFSVIPTILSSGVTPTPFTACPHLHLPKIMTKAQALLNRGGEGRSALEEGGLEEEIQLVSGGVPPFLNLLRSLPVFPQIHLFAVFLALARKKPIL